MSGVEAAGNVQQQVALQVMSKMMDAMRQQGEAQVEMIEQAANVAEHAGEITESGHIDLLA